MRVTTQKHFVLRRCYQLAWWKQHSDANRRSIADSPKKGALEFPLEHPIKEASCGAQWIPWRQKKMSETCQNSDEIRRTRSSGNSHMTHTTCGAPPKALWELFHLKVTCSPIHARKVTSSVTSSSFMILGTCTHTSNPKRAREHSERRKSGKFSELFSCTQSSVDGTWSENSTLLARDPHTQGLQERKIRHKVKNTNWAFNRSQSVMNRK